MQRPKVDDLAVTLLDHDLAHLASHIKHRIEVGGEDTAPSSVIHLGCRGCVAHASVVDQNIDAAIHRLDGSNHVCNLSSIGDITAGSKAAHAQLLDLCLDSLETVKTASTNGNVSALASQCLSKLHAQARRGARNERNLASKVEHIGDTQLPSKRLTVVSAQHAATYLYCLMSY